MRSSGRQDGRVSWIALVALAALVVGIGMAFRQWRPPRTAGTSVPGPVDEPPERVIGEALERAPVVDSTAFKQRWIEAVRGVDLAGLDPRRCDLFLRYANAERCTCGCGYTLAGCRASDMTCDVSGPRLDALLDSVRAGHITSARGVRARPHHGG